MDECSFYAKEGFVDYLGGREIKVDLSRDMADGFLYNRAYGAGAFEKIVAQMRATMF